MRQVVYCLATGMFNQDGSVNVQGGRSVTAAQNMASTTLWRKNGWRLLFTGETLILASWDSHVEALPHTCIQEHPGLKFEYHSFCCMRMRV